MSNLIVVQNTDMPYYMRSTATNETPGPGLIIGHVEGGIEIIEGSSETIVNHFMPQPQRYRNDRPLISQYSTYCWEAIGLASILVISPFIIYGIWKSCYFVSRHLNIFGWAWIICFIISFIIAIWMEMSESDPSLESSFNDLTIQQQLRQGYNYNSCLDDNECEMVIDEDTVVDHEQRHDILNYPKNKTEPGTIQQHEQSVETEQQRKHSLQTEQQRQHSLETEQQQHSLQTEQQRQLTFQTEQHQKYFDPIPPFIKSVHEPNTLPKHKVQTPTVPVISTSGSSTNQ